MDAGGKAMQEQLLSRPPFHHSYGYSDNQMARHFTFFRPMPLATPRTFQNLRPLVFSNHTLKL
jgi:hypothetical protein